MRSGGSQLDALTHFGKHAIDRIQGLKHHIHELGINPTRAFTQNVEHVFGDMAALHQLIELKESGAAFDGVKPTENRIEQIHIVRAAFQLNQLLGQLLKNLAGLYQEVLENLFIGAEAHSRAP